jgi:DNA invertase Pin-like site-specific DNA recombinase
MRYGYCRVSTRGQDVELQIKELKPHGIDKYFCDEGVSGKNMNRPQYKAMCKVLKPGDTVLVTKLDRFARSTTEGIIEIKRLLEMGVIIDILNMARIGTKPGEQLLLTMMLAFAEFERNMIIERTQEGKALAKMKEDYKEGRPKKYTKDNKRVKRLFQLLDDGASLKEASEFTQISLATVKRLKAERKAEQLAEQLKGVIENAN